MQNYGIILRVCATLFPRGAIFLSVVCRIIAVHHPMPNEQLLPQLEVETTVGMPAKCILYNDDWHTFDEVIVQIVKATGCSIEDAERLTWEVHTNGKAAVYEGALSECLRVSSILEEIALHTSIEM
ncbi:MAG: hypothetical protein KatS3mg040_0027 [Candidatus Kapaibacterium sp.]|nr:MAG: hypothetical protein KatS3mg040_0027 [Candidatus Kapabacteria bacterium]